MPSDLINPRLAVLCIHTTEPSLFRRNEFAIGDSLYSYCVPLSGVLVANKTDLDQRRVVSPKEGKDFATQHGLAYFEVSAVSSDGWMDGRAAGRMGGWMDGWMDGWIDG